MYLVLTRGLVAIAWAVIFMAVADSHKTVTAGAGILVVLYPLIDVVACLIDAQGQHGPARRLLLANSAVSAVAAVALAVAATGSVATSSPSSACGRSSVVRRSSSSHFAVAPASVASGPC